MGELEFDRVAGIARSYQESRILLTASDLNLFTLLGENPASAKSIAEPRAWNEEALATLLDALTVMGFLEKCRGQYFVPRVNRELFSADDPRRLTHIIKHFASSWSAWSNLTARIIGAGELPRTPDLLHHVETMHALAQPLAPGVAALVRPEMGRTFLDIGGGVGTFTIAFLDRDRSLQASLLERPEVLEITRSHLKEADYDTAVRLIASDFLTGEWPDAQDLIFVSAVLHTQTTDACRKLFCHAFSSLKAGGRIVIRDYIMSEDRLFPRSGAFSSLQMLVSTEGARPYTFGELRRWLEGQGFRDVRLIQDGERMNGVMEAFKPSS
jgi:precorrin-6B methylase 2